MIEPSHWTLLRAFITRLPAHRRHSRDAELCRRVDSGFKLLMTASKLGEVAKIIADILMMSDRLKMRSSGFRTVETAKDYLPSK
ncbi:hypothetical protein CPY51_23025 [Rhizobium tubonense]|uniref:Uncharacterized protein n=1 Tax=Rhizobium tubonense TaxID=484088 RepID=A0A2W4EF16_9HYPH|nr:hypothetical protein CPY51_23025 [Rhizobium tubonense]